MARPIFGTRTDRTTFRPKWSRHGDNNDNAALLFLLDDSHQLGAVPFLTRLENQSISYTTQRKKGSHTSKLTHTPRKLAHHCSIELNAKGFRFPPPFASVLRSERVWYCRRKFGWTIKKRVSQPRGSSFPPFCSSRFFFVALSVVGIKFCATPILRRHGIGDF